MSESRLDRLVALHERTTHVNDDVAEALGGRVPRYALLTAEGSDQSTYQDNPDLSVFDTADALAVSIADQLVDGWPPIRVLDLETGEDVGFTVKVEIEEAA
jgi:hypothetical protein